MVALNSLFWSEQGMGEFGWRVPFLVGAVTAVVALLLRFGLEDTPAFREQEAAGETSASPLRLALRTQKGAMARGFFFTVSWTVPCSSSSRICRRICARRPASPPGSSRRRTSWAWSC